jgi:hypothetical protein
MDTKRTPTTRELVAARKAMAPKQENTVPAAADNRSYRERYLDQVAPSSIVGRMIKFSKDGVFVTADDIAEVPEDAEFLALCDQTLIGWLKFNEPGEPPQRAMGLLYDNFVMPLGRPWGTPTQVNGRRVSTVSLPTRGSTTCIWFCKTSPRVRCSRLSPPQRRDEARSDICFGHTIGCSGTIKASTRP